MTWFHKNIILLILPGSFLRREGGSRVGSQILLYFTVLKIQNIWVQELFTELKNIDFWPRTVFRKLGRIARCREMYRISHIVEIGLKIQRGESFLGAGWLDCPQNWFIPSSHQCGGSYGAFFGNFHFQLISGTFSMKFRSIFEKSSKSHPKSPRNRLKIEISKKGSIGLSALMGWRYKPILGTIQSPNSEKTVTGMNFWTIFSNMGNPIHFATFRETCRVRDGTEFHHDKLFKFRKKFLNPCIPNF